jgi:predicted SprT family Zn-dependent metalloprotease
VLVNPRLDQPWIARCFFEHVLFHELCHHAQACAPVRGERPHSQRFRAMERSYPYHAEAQAWERSHLDRLLSRIG